MPKDKEEDFEFVEINHHPEDSDSEQEPFVKINPNFYRHSRANDTDASYDTDPADNTDAYFYTDSSDTEAESSAVEEPEFGDPAFDEPALDEPAFDEPAFDEPALKATSKIEKNIVTNPLVQDSESKVTNSEVSDSDEPEETIMGDRLNQATYSSRQSDLSRNSFCNINNRLLFPRQNKQPQPISEHVIARTLESEAGYSKAIVFSMTIEDDRNNTIEAIAARKAFADMTNFLFLSYSFQLKLFGAAHSPRLVLFISGNREKMETILTMLKNKEFESNALKFFNSQTLEKPESTTEVASELVNALN